jgi:hypothetical protein
MRIHVRNRLERGTFLVYRRQLHRGIRQWHNMATFSKKMRDWTYLSTSRFFVTLTKRMFLTWRKYIALQHLKNDTIGHMQEFHEARAIQHVCTIIKCISLWVHVAAFDTVL